MRRALLLLIMFAGFALIAWSGWQNLHQRQRAAQLQQAARVDLIPDAPSPSAAAEAALRGKPAPAFTLANLDGKKVSLKDFKGHPMVLNFWATYCEPCKVEMPWLEEFSKKYAPDGFQVVGVDYDSEVGKDAVEKNAHKLGVTYPILLSDPKIEKDYLSDSNVLPMSFYVDRTGKVVAVTAGLGGKDELESMVKQTIAAGAKE
jgi:thiol-disulfide isomerase/thioredoxin